MQYFGSDTPVISNLVQTFAAMVGGRNRTDIFTGCIIAMLAGQRLEKDFWIIRSIRIVSVNFNPVHNPSANNLRFPTTGILFSAWQAITHELQPIHELRSIASPQ